MTASLAPLTETELNHARTTIGAIERAVASRVVGQERLRESMLVGLLTGGHILLESLPGLAKTTAAEALAGAIDGSFKRIQCTPDLLPSDLIGSQVYEANSGEFTTRLGPVHANFVLLDEVNRSSAKTQSAMLEAMQERQTSIGGERYPLPKPFLVIATQNPIEQEGTYVLSEAQLDRFMLKDVLDYPSPRDEAEILHRIDTGVFAETIDSVCDTAGILKLQELTKRVYIDPAITEYIVSLTYVSRHADKYLSLELAGVLQVGASPRASINLSTGARAVALIQGRNHVVPEDVRHLAHRVLRHRLLLGFEAGAKNIRPETLIDAMIAAVRTP